MPERLLRWLTAASDSRLPPSLRGVHVHLHDGLATEHNHDWAPRLVVPLVDLAAAHPHHALTDWLIDLCPSRSSSALTEPPTTGDRRFGWHPDHYGDVPPALADGMRRLFRCCTPCCWDTLWLPVSEWLLAVVAATSPPPPSDDLRLLLDRNIPPEEGETTEWWGERLLRAPPRRCLGLHDYGRGVAARVLTAVLADPRIAGLPRWDLKLRVTDGPAAAALVAALDARRRSTAAGVGIEDTVLSLSASAFVTDEDSDGATGPLLASSALSLSLYGEDADGARALGRWLSRTLAPRSVTVLGNGYTTDALFADWRPSPAATRYVDVLVAGALGPQALEAFPAVETLRVRYVAYDSLRPAASARRHGWTPALAHLPRLQRLTLDLGDTPYKFNDIPRHDEHGWLADFAHLMAGVRAHTPAHVHCILPSMHARFHHNVLGAVKMPNRFTHGFGPIV